MPETQVLLKKAVTLALWGKRHAGRQGPTAWGAMGAVLGVLLRNYGFTDLPPSLPLPRSDPVTRTRESSYRRMFMLPSTEHCKVFRRVWGVPWLSATAQLQIGSSACHFMFRRPNDVHISYNA